ncbi:MAG: hypothetical protein M3406_04145 [Chloroflexota bacterium]|nr:hypothetical protein [Chloroflexota bacterium]
MGESLMFVQFPHPGSEHRPTESWMDWNRRDHARKFLKTHGTYISDGELRTGPFTLWGEWEPQSRVVETLPKQGRRYPRWLHEPFWQVPQHRRLLQNTDPLVFDHFLYSNCRQRRNRKLRELAPGSLIVFGSNLEGAFVLDTVFVVSDTAENFTGASAGDIRCADWVRAVVFEPLRMSPKSASEIFRLYRGRSYREARAGPFSFVPCHPHGVGEYAFPRPELRLPARWITPNLRQGAKATQASPADLLWLWDEIIDQVIEKAGLALGVHLAAPPHGDGLRLESAG